MDGSVKYWSFIHDDEWGITTDPELTGPDCWEGPFDDIDMAHDSLVDLLRQEAQWWTRRLESAKTNHPLDLLVPSPEED